jgi:predicted GNAT family acetyltransferase
MPDLTETAVRDNPALTRYEAHADGRIAGYILYRPRKEFLTMVHTEVEPEWEGHGIGSALVRGALDDVRARGLKVRPLCPFVRSFIERHPEYRDLVAS